MSEKNLIIPFKTVGRRKRATARVRLSKGDGATIINGVPLEEYFNTDFLRDIVMSPLKLTGNEKKFDVKSIVIGGGTTGQAEAVRHGIARALVKMDEALKKTLRSLGFLTRDSREKERKKFGLKRARRAPQWSKR